MDENEITQRLRDAGDQPVPGEVRATHLSQMHAATPVVEKPKRFGRLAVAAAAFVGFAVGSTGLAMAGALPDPAQNVAHDVLAIVNVNVEKPANRGQCVSQIANDPNRTPEQKKGAKDLECPKGKPDHAGHGNGKAKGRPDGVGPPEGHPNDGDPCKGPPRWAGNKMTLAEKDEARAERATTCGRDIEAPLTETETETETEELGTETETETEELETEATEPTDQVEG
jgi:hypothetical protein